MSRLSRFAKTAAVVCSFTGAVHAAFEPLGYGAAAKGLGGAYVALAEDGTAAYWNPAGLGLLRNPQLTASMEDLQGLGLLRYAALGYAQPRVGGGTLSFHLLHLDTTGDADFFKYAESTYMVAYGRRWNENLNFGLGMRYYSALANDVKATGLGFDVGVLWQVWEDKLRLAAAWQDLNQPKISWDTGARDALPYTLRLGSAYRLTENTDLALQWDKRMHEDSHLRFGGAQRFLKDLLTLRAGMHKTAEQDGWGLALGGGFAFKRFNIDYAWETLDTIGDSQTVSFTMRFGPQ